MGQIFISKNNSTEIALAANTSFIGQADILTSFQELDINVFGAPLIAPADLYFEFSPDGYYWDISVPLSLAGPSIPPIILRTVLPYFRVRYLNGAINLTELRLTTVLHRDTAIRLTRFLSQDIDPNEPIENIRIAKGERSTLGTTSSVSASASSVLIASYNTDRRGITVFNDSTAILYLNLGSAAALNFYTVRVIPGAYYEAPFGYVGVIYGIWDSAVGSARITIFS